MSRPPPPESCAQCGTPLPRSARACPECGADERTGWREASIYDGLDLPDEEDGGDSARGTGRRGVRWYWWIVAVVLIVLLWRSALGGH